MILDLALHWHNGKRKAITLPRVPWIVTGRNGRQWEEPMAGKQILKAMDFIGNMKKILRSRKDWD